MTDRRFSESFTWGVATSSYQIEGATNADGRGESIWDRFSADADNIEDQSTGEVACDHYNLWSRDLQIMSELGVNAYRFSVAWPRILPTGRGATEQRGLDFYSRLVDGLLDLNITPFVTLYHWDLPQILQDRGGWTARETAEAFVEYADIVSRHLGDRVKHWITHNEPWCISVLGHQTGEHAPGHKNTSEALATSHHLLLSHGWSVPVIRQNTTDAEVGIVLNLVPSEPASPSEADAKACREFEGAFNRWFLDPLYDRGYPEDIIALHHRNGDLESVELPFVQEGDLDAITAPTDFLGINYYSRAVLRSTEIPEQDNAERTVFTAPESEHTDMGWEVYPKGIQDLLEQVHRDYQPSKIYITENGCAYATGPDDNGAIQDDLRVDYFRGHLSACLDAIENGVPLVGYFAWSLLDNFEWAFGYTKRFGLVWVDYQTQERTPKASALWYKNVIANRSIPTP